MLFNQSKCPKCGTLHDDLLAACPHCHTRNNRELEFRSKYQISWLPPVYEIMIFLIGVVGLIVFTTIFSSLFKSTYQTNQLLAMTIINSLSYILLLVLLILLVRKYLVHNILCFFKDKKAYFFGLLMIIPLLGISAVCAMIADTIYPSINVNQDLSVNMIKTYPVVCFFVMGIIGPICEEIAYRIGLFSFLRRINRILAYVLCIIIFSLAHIDFTSKDLIAELVALPQYLVGAILLTFTYEKKGPAASITLHIANNIISIIIILMSGMGV